MEKTWRSNEERGTQVRGLREESLIRKMVGYDTEELVRLYKRNYMLSWISIIRHSQERFISFVKMK